MHPQGYIFFKPPIFGGFFRHCQTWLTSVQPPENSSVRPPLLPPAGASLTLALAARESGGFFARRFRPDFHHNGHFMKKRTAPQNNRLFIIPKPISIFTRINVSICVDMYA